VIIIYSDERFLLLSIKAISKVNVKSPVNHHLLTLTLLWIICICFNGWQVHVIRLYKLILIHM